MSTCEKLEFQKVSELGIKKKDDICKKLADVGNNLIVNRNAIQKLGLDAALLLAELVAQYNQWDTLCELDNQFGFYATVDLIDKRCQCKQEKQNKLFKKLAEADLLHLVYKDMPKKRYVYLHLEQIYNIYSQKM